MARQLSFAETGFYKGMQKSRKGQFLEQMEKIVPWMALVAIIAPFYAKEPEKAGRRPYPLLVMLRIHLMQHWFNLSDPAMESELYDSMAMRKFENVKFG